MMIVCFGYSVADGKKAVMQDAFKFVVRNFKFVIRAFLLMR